MAVQQELLLQPIVVEEDDPEVFYNSVLSEGSLFLHPSEVLVGVQPVNIVYPQRTSPIEALMILGRARTPDEIGKYPLLASASTLANENEEALRAYEVPFGRDLLESTLTLNDVNEFPALAETALIFHAENQGVQTHLRREEEVGKSFHELRDPETELAKKLSEENGWEFPLYGSIDATLLFIQLGYEYVKKHGDSILGRDYIDKNGENKKIREALKLAADWACRRMDRSPHLLMEYKRETPEGKNDLAWRDSREGFHHANGDVADNTFGIAPFSVQVDAYKAFKAAGELFPEEKGEYDTRSEYLKKVIFDHFWLEDNKGGYFALGSELTQNGKRKLMKVRTSDMGHILDSDILDGNDQEVVKKREMVISTLFSPEMFDRWGIRSLANDEVRFSGGGYHNGSIWLREMARVSRGLKRHGYYGLVNKLDTINAEIENILGIFPENLRGDNARVPTLNTNVVQVERTYNGKREVYNSEPASQLFQAWSVAAIIASLKRIEMVEHGELPSRATDEFKWETEENILSNLVMAA